jgi:hypothetical protein
MITTAQAVMSLRPSVQWSMSGDDVEGITWHTPNVEPLTTIEVQKEVERLTALEPIKARIAELKALLTNSDYKVLPDYDKPDEDIVSQRQAWREEIRTLEAQS